MLHWALDPPLGYKVSRKSSTTMHQPVYALWSIVLQHYLAFLLFKIPLESTKRICRLFKSSLQLCILDLPNDWVLFSFTSLSVCQRRCEVASSRSLQSVCRVGCLKVLLHTQHLLHHILMLSNDIQSTQNKQSSLISEKKVVPLVPVTQPLHK